MKWQSNIYLTSSFNKVLVAKMHLKGQRILSICEAENFAVFAMLKYSNKITTIPSVHKCTPLFNDLTKKKSIQGLITF